MLFDQEKVKNDLAANDVVPEDWGGEHMFVNISAKTGEGIDDLLDAILLQYREYFLRVIYRHGSMIGVFVAEEVTLSKLCGFLLG